MISLVLLFLLLCVGAALLSRIPRIRALGVQLNVLLVVFSVILLALCWGIPLYSPTVSTGEHWRMVLIALIGFLTALVSFVSAFQNLKGGKAIVFATLSFLIGILHLIGLIVSIPFS